MRFWVCLWLSATIASSQTQTILNVSYDVSRELFEDYNAWFESQLAVSNWTIRVKQSHGGASKQVRAVMDGLPADVLTMNQPIDLDILAAEKGCLIAPDWRQKFPNDASPYSSTITFMVRKGNPRNIQDWNDLVRPDVKVIMANPKTSGTGKYGYLAAWMSAETAAEGDKNKALEFMHRFMRNIPVLDTGARGATMTFMHRGIGDVLVALEAEILGTLREHGAERFELIVPPASIRAEFPVAIVEPVVRRRATREAAEAYLSGMYSPDAQKLFARHGFRTQSEGGEFAAVKLLKIDEQFGSWQEAVSEHFGPGGVLDRIYSR